MMASVVVCSLKLGKWPAADRAAWERALAPDDEFLGEGGTAAHLSEPTVSGYTQTYGQWLDFLARTGQLMPEESLAERATPERVAAWRRETKARGLAPTSRRQMLTNLRALLRLLVPGRNWDFITRPGGVSLKRAIRGGPRPFVAREVGEVLVRVLRLHREGLATAEGPERWQALRDAALLAILLTRAPRVGSLVPMSLGHHLVHGDRGGWSVRFPPEHTKGGRRLGYPLDAGVSALLTDYLQLARPHFPYAGRSDALWMGMKGPLTSQGLHRICRRRTLAWFGQAHGPHICRKWLRLSAARRSPELAMDVAEILGHTAEVSVQHYAEASGLHAALRRADRLAQRREELAGWAERAFAEEFEE